MNNCSNTNVQTVNLPVNQGDTVQFLLEFYQDDGVTTIDASSWELASEIRELYDSPIVLASFTFTQEGLLNYQWYMQLTQEQVDALPIAPSTSPGKKNINRLSYDLQATISESQIQMIMQGTVFVNPAVTNP